MSSFPVVALCCAAAASMMAENPVDKADMATNGIAQYQYFSTDFGTSRTVGTPS